MSKEAVQVFLELLQSLAEASDDDLVRALQGRGLSEAVAERALAFVPMACARVILRGATFADGYLIGADAEEPRERHRLDDDSVFVAALKVAKRLGAASPLVICAAARSAEMAVANDLLRPGETAENLAFVEPVLMRLAPAGAPQPRKPWWRVW